MHIASILGGELDVITSETRLHAEWRYILWLIALKTTFSRALVCSCDYPTKEHDQLQLKACRWWRTDY
jgi:hypothetical protein